MASPECYPYAKVGGLGDVISALSKYLQRLGHDVRVCLPLYGSISVQAAWKAYNDVPIHLGNRHYLCRVWATKDHSITYYFVEYQKYFQRKEIYAGPWGPHFDNGERFSFFSKAVIDLCYHFKWYPDVLHCHDWTTGLIPVMLNTCEINRPMGKTASVFTIHNLEHQGLFSPDLLAYAGIPFSEYRPDSLESMGAINCMKGAIFHSTKVSTVSPTYAQEIQHPPLSCGLHDCLKFKAADLIGILNGIDDELWDPSSDPSLPANYSQNNLSGKAICKQTLQQSLHLTVKPTIPIFGVISRLYYQKGLDMLMDILPKLFSQMQIQIVVLGSGEPSWEDRFRNLANQYPRQMHTHIGYDSDLAHLIEAGSDFFIMPSRFEPCGLNQMYSMRYGTLPIVHHTGGLADTVCSLDENTTRGTGFVFYELTHDALFNTIGWACATYYDKPQVIADMQQQAMQKDFSWGSSARQYERVYNWALQQRALVK